MEMEGKKDNGHTYYTVNVTIGEGRCKGQKKEEAIYREREEKDIEQRRQHGGRVKRVSVGALVRVAEWVIERD